MTRNRYYSGPVSDHFDGVRFFEPGAPPDKSRGDLLRLITTRYADWPAAVQNPPASPVLARVDGSALRVTSLGHASHLIQTRGCNILIDPVLSQRASPFSRIGPKRARPPGLALDQLPRIDAILVTHNHYDHLDLATLSALHDRDRCRVVVPLGNDTILRRHQPAFRVDAFDWHQRTSLAADLAVTLMPCRHWSARWLGDRRMALWAAFVIETPDGAIYHIGDTALRDSSLFADVPRRFGAPRLAILPIGAYEPRWFMRDQHVEPRESVTILQACQARWALAHHWGTFRLTAEPIDDPPRRLAIALREAGIDATRFRVQLPGRAFDVPP